MPPDTDSIRDPDVRAQKKQVRSSLPSLSGLRPEVLVTALPTRTGLAAPVSSGALHANPLLQEPSLSLQIFLPFSSSI